jgi:hypothetical protein
VRRQGTASYIKIGTGVRFLIDARESWLVYGDGRILDNALDLLRALDAAELVVTRRVAAALDTMSEAWERERQMQQKDIAERVARDDEDKESPKDIAEWESMRLLTPKEAADLAKVATDIRTTLMAEAAGQVAFFTTPKRYDTERLLGSVGSLMAPGTFAELPDIARFDFGQAGRCIAFELPTAAAFHLMRGTEDVLRWFYCSIVKRDRVDPLMWGSMTTHLGRRRKPPPEVLLANLDNLRRSFRNPTQHPEKIYDVEEVQDLLALSMDVVSRMVKLAVAAQ